MRAEALQSNGAPPSWALERVRQYGVVGLLPGALENFPFILYAQSVPRPPWSGKRDVQRETLHRVYACLLTAPGERPDDETVQPIISGPVDTSGRGSDATVHDGQWARPHERSVNHASSAVCPSGL